MDTSLRFSLARSGPVRLNIHDLRGRRETTLLDGVRAPGEHQVSWAARDAAGRPLATGVYFARLESAGRSETRKLVLVR